MKIGGILNIKSGRPFKTPSQITKLKKKIIKNPKKAILYGVGGLVLLLILFLLWVSKDLPTSAKLAKIHANESTKILDRDGNMLYQTGDERRTIIEKNKIPQVAKEAAVSAEDANFYKHHGLDFKGIARAAYSDLLHMKRSQGGSTITQQFVKNAILTNQRSFIRKIREAILSLEIEQIYSKDDILAMYLNEIPYGGNIYGIQEASQQFFGKTADQLNLSESATLAAVLQAPTYYSPWGTHTDKLFDRKNYVLNRMVELGYVSQADADKAKQEAPTKNNLNFQKKRESINSPHFVMYVREQLVDEYGEKMVDSGGLKVTTTLSRDDQKQAEKAIEDNTDKFTRYGATNAALVSTDVKTGEILAMVGGKDYFDIEHGGNVNVTDSARQPGSSFKPIVYATAFKQQRFSPSFTLYDVITDFNGYVPQNYDGSTHGAVSMRTALANSLNIPAVKTLALVGLPEALKTAESLGITTLNQPERYGLSLVLGGGEVKPIEMAGAFATFGDNGIFHKPVSILKIEDNTGKVLYEYKEAENRSQAIDPQIAYEISNILDDDNARCMVFGCQNALNFGDYHVAAKTGTTSEFHDAWTVGYSTKVAAAVWVGNNDNTKMKSGADGSVVAAPIFHSYMTKFTDDSDFAKPDKIQETTVEKYSNKLPSQYSKDFVKDIFASWQIPTERDDINIVMKVNKTNNKIATDSTPVELIEERLFTNLHNEWGPDWKNYPNWESPVRGWAAAAGMNLLPPQEKDDSYSKRPQIVILNPANGGTVKNSFSISSRVTSDQGVDRVSYYVDNAEAGSSQSDPYSIMVDATKYTNGQHKISARITDKNGVTGETSITVNVSNETAPQISGISTSGAGAGSQKISFITSPASNSIIYYGLTTRYGLSIASGTNTTSHSATLTGLTSGSKYYFSLNATVPGGKSSTFDGNFTAP